VAFLALFGAEAFAGGTRPSERDRWQMPEQVVSALALKKGEVVADIGAGSGYFTMRLARAVGPQGKVYAVDIVPKALDSIERHARDEQLTNIEVIVSRKDDPLLPQGSVDVAFFCETIHEIDDRVPFYRKVRTAMKKAGRMVLIDSAPMNGAAEGRQVSRATAVREAEAAGFRLIREEKFLPEQYFLIFGKVNK
jgi:ubiquinone/menaquinone biosynthesis C-methylase UbiE